MRQNNILQNVFGTIGTILWSGQLIPQVYHNYRRKSTHGLSSYLILLWAISALFLGVYNITQDINIALIVQPQTFGALGALCWVQCLYYGSKCSFRRCLVILLIYLVGGLAFEMGSVYAIRSVDPDSPSVRKGVQFFGIMSTILLSVGLLPQYFEIYKLGKVIGVSYTFMTLDMLGGVFSLLSLAFRKEWDILDGVAYGLVVLLDFLVLLLAIILNPLAARRERQERALHQVIAPQQPRSGPSHQTAANLDLKDRLIT